LLVREYESGAEYGFFRAVITTEADQEIFILEITDYSYIPAWCLLIFAFEQSSLVKLMVTVEGDDPVSRKILKKTGFACKNKMRAYAGGQPLHWYR
jgi:hypothetical protein